MTARRLLRALALATTTLVVIGAGFVVLVLWYHWREARPHRAALTQALSTASTADEMDRQLGPPLPVQPGVSPCPAAGGWGSLPEVAAKCRQWSTTRTYLVQGNSFIYVIYFDSTGRMRDFTLLEN
jgi:hypothetical protein